MATLKILLTGAAGFIGFHTAKKLLDVGHTVIGYDNMNDYYDVSLKEARLKRLTIYDNFKFTQDSLENRAGLEKIFLACNIDYVIHLAAQAGVRHSLESPQTYIDSNITGFLNVLECCRHWPVRHIVYASSSSVYGDSTEFPSKESHKCDTQSSLYGVTKRCNELMAHAYNKLYNMQCTGLRFHTVYGPWGRPDMALFIFTKKILAGEPIPVYNNGDLMRDFTYVDDIVAGIKGVTFKPSGLKVFNIGRGEPVRLMDFIAAIEKATGKEALLDLMPMQLGDVKMTYASTDSLFEHIGYKPVVSVENGVEAFVEWYKDYYE